MTMDAYSTDPNAPSEAPPAMTMDDLEDCVETPVQTWKRLHDIEVQLAARYGITGDVDAALTLMHMADLLPHGELVDRWLEASASMADWGGQLPPNPEEEQVSEELRALARAALGRLEERKDEDIGAWASKLAASIVEAEP